MRQRHVQHGPQSLGVVGHDAQRDRLAAAHAIAEIIGPDELHPDYIIPSVFDRRVGEAVASKVEDAAYATGVARRERSTSETTF